MAKQTATQLRNAVALSAGDQTETGLTRALTNLNKAQNKIANWHKWEFFKRKDNLTLTALDRDYVVTGFSTIDEPYGIRYFDSSSTYEIYPISSEDEWWKYYNNDSTTGGEPTHFRFFNSQIEFNIAPSSSFVSSYSPITVLYRALPTDLSTSTNNSTDFPERFEEVIMDLAIQMTLGNQEDFNTMQFFEREAGKQLLDLRKRDMLKYRNSLRTGVNISLLYSHGRISGDYQ